MLQHATLEVAPKYVERSVEFWELLGFELVDAIVVEGFDASLASRAEAGFEVARGSAHWGVLRAKVVAPGGHVIELMEAQPR
jgi:hypothetical protein